LGGLDATRHGAARAALLTALALVAIIVPVAVAMTAVIPSDTVPPEFTSVPHCHIEPPPSAPPSTVTCARPELGGGEILDLEVAVPSEMTAGAHTITWNGGGSSTPTAKSSIKLEAGTYVATWTATDAAENVSMVEQVIIVEDTKPPVFKPGSGVEYKAEAQKVDTSLVAESLGIRVTDPADLSGPISPSEQTVKVGTHMITWTATDGAGHVATMTQTVKITDKEPPIIETCPRFYIVEATANSTPLKYKAAGITVTDKATAVDDITVEPNKQTLALGERSRVRWTATDGVGLTATCDQLLAVRDRVKPEIRDAAMPDESITTLPPVSISGTGASTRITAGIAGVTATDAPRSEMPTIEASPASLGFGTHTVTWTAIDSVGHRSEPVTQSVTVTDPSFKLRSIAHNNGGFDLTFTKNVDASTAGSIYFTRHAYAAAYAPDPLGFTATTTTTGNTVRVEPTVFVGGCYSLRSNPDNCAHPSGRIGWIFALSSSLSSTTGSKLDSTSPTLSACAGRDASGGVSFSFVDIPGCAWYTTSYSFSAGHSIPTVHIWS